LTSEVFYEDDLVAVSPPGHSILRRRPITASDLCREPLILREPGSGTRAVVERALKRLGLTPKPVLSLASPEAIKRAVTSGVGLTIMSRLAVQLELAAGSLVLVPVKDLVIHRPLHLQRGRGRALSPAVVRFLDLLAFRFPRPRKGGAVNANPRSAISGKR